MRFLITFTLLIGMALVADASPELMFEAGSKAYLDGEFAQALEIWSEIEQTGYFSGNLYYNIGNAYFKVGKAGKAILYWEKALSLKGSDQDIEMNLNIARASLPNKQDEIVRLPVLNWLDKFHSQNSPRTFPLLSIALVVAVIIGLSLARWTNKRNLRRLGKSFAMFCLVLLITTWGLIFYSHQEQQSNRMGIVTILESKVYSAPSVSSGKHIFTAYEGMKFKLVRELEEWYEITLGKDKQGWVRKTDVGII